MPQGGSGKDDPLDRPEEESQSLIPPAAVAHSCALGASGGVDCGDGGHGFRPLHRRIGTDRRARTASNSSGLTSSRDRIDGGVGGSNRNREDGEALLGDGDGDEDIDENEGLALTAATGATTPHSSRFVTPIGSTPARDLDHRHHIDLSERAGLNQGKLHKSRGSVRT